MWIKPYTFDGCSERHNLEESSVSPLAGKLFVLVGAGGAGRAMAFGARSKGARVVIFNRNFGNNLTQPWKTGHWFKILRMRMVMRMINIVVISVVNKLISPPVIMSAHCSSTIILVPAYSKIRAKNKQCNHQFLCNLLFNDSRYHFIEEFEPNAPKFVMY